MTLRLPSGLTVTAHQWRQAVRLLAACALAGVPTALLDVPDWYWSLVPAIAVMQPDLRHTLTSGRDRMIATVIGAVVGLLLIYLRLQGLPGTPLFVVAMLPLGLLTGMHPNLRLSCTTLIGTYQAAGTIRRMTASKCAQRRATFPNSQRSKLAKAAALESSERVG